MVARAHRAAAVHQRTGPEAQRRLPDRSEDVHPQATSAGYRWTRTISPTRAGCMRARRSTTRTCAASTPSRSRSASSVRPRLPRKRRTWCTTCATSRARSAGTTSWTTSPGLLLIARAQMAGRAARPRRGLRLRPHHPCRRGARATSTSTALRARRHGSAGACRRISAARCCGRAGEAGAPPATPPTRASTPTAADSASTCIRRHQRARWWGATSSSTAIPSADSHDVDKKHFVGDLNIGAAVTLGRWKPELCPGPFAAGSSMARTRTTNSARWPSRSRSERARTARLQGTGRVVAVSHHRPCTATARAGPVRQGVS